MDVVLHFWTLSNIYFFNENVSISITISLEFVPKVLINNIQAFVQTTSHYLNHWWLDYWVDTYNMQQRLPTTVG